MAEFDGEVVINTRMNTSDAETGAESLSAAMQSVVQAVEAAGQALNATLQQISGTLSNTQDFVVGFAEGLSEGLEEAAGQAQNTGGAVQSATQTISVSADNASRNVSKLAYSFVSAANAGTRFGSGAMYALKNVISYAKKAKSYINGTKESIENSAKGMADMVKRTAMMMIGVRGVYMLVRKVMSAFTTGAKSLAGYSDSFNKAMSNITNSMNQLKYNVAAVVAPVIEALEPIITSLFDKINAGLNKVAELMAALTGKGTYQKAIKQATSYANAQTKAATATQNSLNALEELNVIGKDDSSSSSSSTPMYETAQVSSAMQTIADKWREIFASGDFRRIGTEIGNLAKNLDKIPWKKVEKAARTLGTNAAELLNGFIQSGGLSSIGNALGNWENQIGYLLGGFIDDFEWEANGKSIGEALVAYMLPTDWDQFRHNAYAGFKGLATMLNSIVETEDLWENIGTTIAGKILVAIESWYGFVTEFHFDSLGEGIAKAINQFFADMAAVNKETGLNGWEELGVSITDTIVGLMTVISKAITDTDWGAIGKAICDLFNKIDWAQFWESFKELAFSIVSALAKGFDAIAEENPVGAAILGVLTAATVLNKVGLAGSTLGKSLVGGLGKALGVSAIGLAAGTAGLYIGKWLGKMFFPDDADNLYGDLWLQNVVDAFSLLGERISEKWDEIYKGICGWIDNIKRKAEEFAEYFGVAINGDDKSGAKNAFIWLLEGMPEEARVGGGHSSSGASIDTPYTEEELRKILLKMMGGAASGAVIPRTASEHLIRVGDNNAETEIISPLSTMKQAMLEALSEANMATGEQNISLTIDGQQMFNWIVKKNKETFMRTHQNQLVY